MNATFKAFINNLRCPITKSRLREMNVREISDLNSLISRGQICYVSGLTVNKQIENALISIDSKIIYLIEKNILVLLPPLAIITNEAKLLNYESLKSVYAKKEVEKKKVQEFYDQIGWQKSEKAEAEEAIFIDAIKFEDLREVSQEYIHNCHLRVNKYLQPAGKYLLDVASGPIQYSEYLSYSKEFDARICIDISLQALKEAKKKIGERGIYLLADITNLPLQDNSVDAVVSLHTLYHVPADEQKTALQEIHRVLQPNASAVVVYSWGKYAPLNRILLPIQIIYKFVKIFKFQTDKPKNLDKSEPELYFHAYDYKWFLQQNLNFHLDVVVWRSLSVPFLKKWIHKNLLGKQILNLIYWLEDRYPQIAGRLGQYPMFVIKK